jgi:hypothetical protein
MWDTYGHLLQPWIHFLNTDDSEEVL